MTQRTFMLGRDPSCDFVEADPKVSEFHANLTFTRDGGLYVTDLRSSNGTWFITARGREAAQSERAPADARVGFGPNVVYGVPELLARMRSRGRT